jgi:hypothetical protein
VLGLLRKIDVSDEHNRNARNSITLSFEFGWNVPLSRELHSLRHDEHKISTLAGSRMAPSEEEYENTFFSIQERFDPCFECQYTKQSKTVEAIFAYRDHQGVKTN